MPTKAKTAKKPTKRLKKGSKLEPTKTLSGRKAGGSGSASGKGYLQFSF